MEAERTRILEMLKEGRITVEQAGELLNAVEESHRDEGGPGAEREGSEAGPDHPRKVNWGQFGRALAEQVQRHVVGRLAGRFGGTEGVGDPTRENYTTAKLSQPLLERMGDGTSYANFGHLIIGDDVPAELLERKIGSFANYGTVRGPSKLIAILEDKCEANYGTFSDGAEEEADWPHGPRIPRPPKPPRPPRPARRQFAQRRRQRGEEAVLTSYSVEDDRIGMEITCHTGDLELAGAEEGELRLIVRKPTRGGESLPDGWEKEVPWSADQEDGQHRFTLGDPDNPDATNDLTFRFEIPCEAEISAHTEGGYIAAASLTGALVLKTDGGDISVSEIEGSVKAETGGGDISVSKVEGEVRADTAGGDISVGGVEGEATLTSGGGDISVSEVEGAATAKTGGGNVNASGVQGELTVESGGGDISVSDVEGAATATTGGGDVSVSDVEGDLLAETGGGNIAVSDVSGAVTGRSGGGDIAVANVQGELTIDAAGGSTSISNVSGPVSMNQ